MTASGSLLALAPVAAAPLDAAGASPFGALGVGLALGAFSLLPAVVLCCTHFVRFAIVLGFVRTGLGTPAAPPTQVITGLALILAAFSAAPLASALERTAFTPYSEGQLTAVEALRAAEPPLRDYLLERCDERSLEVFIEAAELQVDKPDDLPLRVVVPAFVLSELSLAFALGLSILLPFLVIDLLVAIVLTSLGMVMVPPASVALPLKLLVFTAIDGWRLVVGALLAGAMQGGAG